MATKFDQKRYEVLKGRLAKVVKSGDHDAIIAECDAALAEFEKSLGYPDDWSRWERAKDDATFAKRRTAKW